MWRISPRCNPSWQYPSSPGQSGRSPGKEWSPALLPVWEKNYIRRGSRLPAVLQLTTGRGCWCAFVSAHFCRWSWRSWWKKLQKKVVWLCGLTRSLCCWCLLWARLGLSSKVANFEVPSCNTSNKDHASSHNARLGVKNTYRQKTQSSTITLFCQSIKYTITQLTKQPPTMSN